MIKNFVTQAEMKAAIVALEEKYHGKDDIYIQVFGAQEPADKWGGTWELISQGRMLIGASDDYPLGSTGGEATHTMTVDEMPSHSHKVGAQQTGSSQYFAEHFNATHNTTGDNVWWVTTDDVGGSKPFNIMPPCLAVNIWHKISD